MITRLKNRLYFDKIYEYLVYLQHLFFYEKHVWLSALIISDSKLCESLPCIRNALRSNVSIYMNCRVVSYYEEISIVSRTHIIIYHNHVRSNRFS